MENNNQIQLFSESISKIQTEIKKDIVGQEDVIDNVLIAIISGGNVLLEFY